MAGKILVKDVGGGLRGSTSGLRFNPREAPEFVEEDRNYGRDDADGKELDDRKRRKAREKRHRKIVGMHHVSVKVPKKKRPEGDKQRHDEELSEMTGPASSTGAPLDAATGARTGTGSAMGGAPVNIMTGEPMDVTGDIFRKKRKKGPKKSRFGRHGKTKTVRGVLQSERTKATARRRKGHGSSVEEERHKHRGGELARNYSTRPDLLTQQYKGLNQRTTGRGARHFRQLPHRGRTWSGIPTHQIDPRNRTVGIAREQKGRQELTGRGFTKGPLGLGERTAGAASGGGYTPLSPPKQPKQPYQPGVARTTAGMDMGTHSATAPSGMQGGYGIASPIAASSDTLARTEDMLFKRSPLNSGDLLELRQLIRELRRLMRSGALRKAGFEDAEHDDERPSPNAQHKVTSSPTGATEVDPDDDPRYWGAHPIGLLLPRRGHQ